eukprot:gb/GEZJ01002697.1/.p1 GENE.gb/GEZJ01002697.1/~~gb/GEZJ01002697.1/.p1  ORF type:complete len:125 (-),score=14.58 gb/GEZJ01002697.1/:1042-1416(-)
MASPRTKGVEILDGCGKVLFAHKRFVNIRVENGTSAADLTAEVMPMPPKCDMIIGLPHCAEISCTEEFPQAKKRSTDKRFPTPDPVYRDAEKEGEKHFTLESIFEDVADALQRNQLIPLSERCN